MTPERRQADDIWRDCFDCGVKVRLSDIKAHVASHIDRPGGDAYTIPEVAKALGIPDQTVRDRVKRGDIQGFVQPVPRVGMKGSGHSIWVSRQSLAQYVSALLAERPERAAVWAETGRLG